MSYATKANMLERYEEKDLIQLTDIIDPYTGEIVDSILERALDDASATIDLYISGRYDLPIDETPAALVKMACILAYYDLHKGRYDEDLRSDYEDVLKALSDIAAGKIKLDQGGQEPKSAAAIAKTDGPNRVFNRDSLKGF